MAIDEVVGPVAEVRLWVHVRRVVLWRSAIAAASILLHLLKKCMLPFIKNTPRRLPVAGNCAAASLR